MKALISASFAALTLVATVTPLSAADTAPAAAQTVWVDGKGQKSMAEKTNKIHAEMAAQGWTFQDLDVYIEDGDMKGLFVTYIRAPAP